MKEFEGNCRGFSELVLLFGEIDFGEVSQTPGNLSEAGD